MTRPSTYGYRDRMKIGGAALAAAVLMLAGCGGNDSPAEPAGSDDSASVATDAEESGAPTPKEVNAKPYFQSLTSREPTEMARAARGSAPGSLAMAYMTHQMNGTNADLDGGLDTLEETLTEKGNEFQSCSDNPESGDTTCYTYNKFKVAAGGKLASFSINGKPLTGRVVLGGGKVVDSSVAKVTFLSAYQTANGYLAVTVKLRAKDAPVVFYDPSATYRAPNGQQRALANQSGLSELAADSVGTQAFYFKGPLKFGGTMTLQIATHRSVNEYGDATLVPLKVGG